MTLEQTNTMDDYVLHTDFEGICKVTRSVLHENDDACRIRILNALQHVWDCFINRRYIPSIVLIDNIEVPEYAEPPITACIPYAPDLNGKTYMDPIGCIIPNREVLYGIQAAIVEYCSTQHEEGHIVMCLPDAEDDSFFKAWLDDDHDPYAWQEFLCQLNYAHDIPAYDYMKAVWTAEQSDEDADIKALLRKFYVEIAKNLISLLKKYVLLIDNTSKINAERICHPTVREFGIETNNEVDFSTVED